MSQVPEALKCGTESKPEEPLDALPSRLIFDIGKFFLQSGNIYLIAFYLPFQVFNDGFIESSTFRSSRHGGH